MDVSSRQAPAPMDERTDARVNDIEPRGDQGAIAEDGFGFQHDCIGWIAVRMLSDESIARIVCETHEDAQLHYLDGSVELVGCKSRNGSRPWTPTSLVSEGGLAHLFKSWIDTGRVCRCRLMTDGEFSPGRDGAQGLVTTCASRDAATLATWAAELAPALRDEPETVASFLASMTFHWDDLRPRAALGAMNALRLRPWLRANKLPYTLETHCYALLRDRIAQCCRASTLDPLRGVSLLEASLDPLTSARRGRVANRTLDRATVEACMLEYQSSSPPLSGDPGALDHTKMVIKLERGKVPEQVIASAKRLRASWYERQSAMELRAPGGDGSLHDLRARALLIIADAMAAQEHHEPYGREMYGIVRAALRLDAVGDISMIGLSDELLLGLAFQLTDECELFWSKPFDVEAALE